jgi:hypothetical protein
MVGISKYGYEMRKEAEATTPPVAGKKIFGKLIDAPKSYSRAPRSPSFLTHSLGKLRPATWPPTPEKNPCLRTAGLTNKIVNILR